MNDLRMCEQELKQAIRLFEEWQMRGYDTPQLTYHEQLEMYHTRVDILTEKIKELMK